MRASLETWRGALLITAAEHELPADASHPRRRRSGRHRRRGRLQRVRRARATRDRRRPRVIGTSGSAAKDAEAAYAELAAWMRSDLAPKASSQRGLRRGALPTVVGVLVGGDARPARTLRVGLPGPEAHQHAHVGDRARTPARARRAWSRWPTSRQRPGASDRRHRHALDDVEGLHRAHDGRTRRRALRHRRTNSILRRPTRPGGLGRGAVLHQSQRGPQSPRHHVVPDARQDEVLVVAIRLDLVSRVDPGPPPPDRDGAARPRIARADSTVWSATPAATPRAGRSTPND